MNPDKILWIKIWDAFITEHGREPSDDEMYDVFSAALGSRIDAAEDK